MKNRLFLCIRLLVFCVSVEINRGLSLLFTIRERTLSLNSSLILHIHTCVLLLLYYLLINKGTDVVIFVTVLINPWHACAARVTVVSLSMCLSVMVLTAMHSCQPFQMTLRDTFPTRAGYTPKTHPLN